MGLSRLAGVATLAFLASIAARPSVASAGNGTLVGKIEFPNVTKRPVVTRGFLDRTENPLAPLRAVNFAQGCVIVLEGQEKGTPGEVTWELAGESFGRPVIAAPAGASLMIKNTSKTSRTLVAKEDKNLVPPGPINPTGPKSFRIPDDAAGKVFTLGDSDAPHLKGRLVVVNTPYIAYPDESGHFEVKDLPAGSYKMKIYYRDGWLQLADDSVDVSAKGKTDFNPKVPASVFTPAEK